MSVSHIPKIARKPSCQREIAKQSSTPTLLDKFMADAAMNAASESSAVKTISATLYDFGNKHRSNIKNRVRRIYPKCQISMGGNSCEVEAEHHSIIFGSSECKCDLPVCEFGDRFQRVQTFLTVE